MGGRKPTFLLGRLEGSGHRHCLGSLRLDLEKIREAAERVARSEGLEIYDVEWKVGKQRFLRVIIDRVPKVGAAMSDSAGQILAPSEASEGAGRSVNSEGYNLRSCGARLDARGTQQYFEEAKRAVRTRRAAKHGS